MTILSYIIAANVTSLNAVAAYSDYIICYIIRS